MTIHGPCPAATTCHSGISSPASTGPSTDLGELITGVADAVAALREDLHVHVLVEAVSQIASAATSTVADPIHLAAKEPDMHAANTYVIRMATDGDEDDLARLAALDSSPSLEGSIIVGELDGAPVVALSLDDDRAISDPFSPTGHLLATMRVRARGLRAVAHMPSLRDRLLAGLPTVYRARLTGRAV